MFCRGFAYLTGIYFIFTIIFSGLTSLKETQRMRIYISICGSTWHSSMKCKLFCVCLDHSFYVPAHSRRWSYISDWEDVLKQPDGPRSHRGWLQECKCWLRWHRRGPSSTVIFCNQVTIMVNQYWWNMHKALKGYIAHSNFWRPQTSLTPSWKTSLNPQCESFPAIKPNSSFFLFLLYISRSSGLFYSLHSSTM